jgi:hypothetical protein
VDKARMCLFSRRKMKREDIFLAESMKDDIEKEKSVEQETL